MCGRQAGEWDLKECMPSKSTTLKPHVVAPDLDPEVLRRDSRSCYVSVHAALLILLLDTSWVSFMSFRLLNLN